MQIRRKAGESTRALGLITKWFHFLILSSRSPSNKHANSAMKLLWAGFKQESSSKGTFSLARVLRFFNSPPLEDSGGKLKESRPSLILQKFSPQSNCKVIYLFWWIPTCGNFLALPTKKLQACNKKLIQYKIVTLMPLQIIKTNSFWPQEAMWIKIIAFGCKVVQKCIQLTTISGHQYPIWMRHEEIMAAVQSQIMST